MEEPEKVGEWLRIFQLGQGGFGKVTLWKNTENETFLAVKMCRFNESSKLTDRQKERWKSEVQMMQKMQHENIVNHVKLPTKLELVLSRCNGSKLPILSMEYCSKGNLRHVLTQPENLCGLHQDEVQYVILDMANAVKYLHNLNITHRDIKPENIVLQECGARPNKTLYKLIDLGYAKELSSEIASFVGTLQYLAPEILRGKSYDCTVDYWSLGCVVFEVVSGLHPFLPFASIYDRVKYLMKKGQNIIHFITDDTGDVSFSTELPKDINISTCLKIDLEKWLQKVLQYDPVQRISSNNVFEELKDVFKKKIIQVFCVYTYRYYYYEITDDTLLITLREWLERDTKIPYNEIFILSNRFFLSNDQKIKVNDCLVDSKPEIYAFRCNETIDKTVVPNMPTLIKKMFSDLTVKSYKWYKLKPIMAQTIFYIHSENQLLNSLICAFNMLIDYVNKIVVNVNKHIDYLKGIAFKLTTEINCYNGIFNSLLCKVTFHSPELVENVKLYEGIVADTNKFIEELNKLVKKYATLVQKKRIFDMKNLNDLRDFHMQRQYEAVITFAKSGQIPGQENYSTKKLMLPVGETLKLRHEMLKYVQNTQYSFFKCVWEIRKRSERYIFKAEGLQQCLNAVSSSLMVVEQEKYAILLNCRNKAKNPDEKLSLQIDEIDTDTILEDNLAIRYSLQEEISKNNLLYWTEMASAEEMNVQ